MAQDGIALPNGSYLEEYLIERELGAGTFGVTYLATDTNLDKQVVIKEYLPNEIAIRQDSVTIMPKSKGDIENFEYGLDSFTKEAKVLAKFNHPNIVKVSRLFHKNGTAYFVMDFEEGEDLQEYIKRHSSFSEEEILSIIMPILDGLRAVHASDFLHRDIKPGNIYIRNNSSPMLIDFGASRMAMGIKSKSLSVVLTEGYAPKEQYSSTSKQGAYTDLYAIGAVMYKMATGITPPEASARADAITDDEPDPFVLLQNRDDLDYSDSFKKAVDWALKFSGKNRPQSVKEFQTFLLSNINKKEDSKVNNTKSNSVTNSNDDEIMTVEPRSSSEKKLESQSKNNDNKGLIKIIGVAILVLLALFYFFHLKPINTEIKSVKKEIWKLENISSNTENYIKDIINNGSNSYDFPMGMMPHGMASGQDADDIAEYIAGGLQGDAPAAYAVCTACHGADSKGNNGMSPNLNNIPLLGMAKKIEKLNERISDLEKLKYTFK